MKKSQIDKIQNKDIPGRAKSLKVGRSDSFWQLPYIATAFNSLMNSRWLIDISSCMSNKTFDFNKFLVFTKNMFLLQYWWTILQFTPLL